MKRPECVEDYLKKITIDDKLRKLILYGSRINFSAVQMLSNPDYRDLTEIAFNLELIKNVTESLYKIHKENVKQYTDEDRR